MKVFGVYIYDYEGSYLQTPLFKDFASALKKGQSEVEKLQERVVEMQEFTKTERTGDISKYKDFKKISDKEWKGGYNNCSGVRIEEIELV